MAAVCEPNRRSCGDDGGDAQASLLLEMREMRAEIRTSMNEIRAELASTRAHVYTVEGRQAAMSSTLGELTTSVDMLKAGHSALNGMVEVLVRRSEMLVNRTGQNSGELREGAGNNLAPTNSAPAPSTSPPPDADPDASPLDQPVHHGAQDAVAPALTSERVLFATDSTAKNEAQPDASPPCVTPLQASAREAGVVHRINPPTHQPVAKRARVRGFLEGAGVAPPAPVVEPIGMSIDPLPAVEPIVTVLEKPNASLSVDKEIGSNDCVLEGVPAERYRQCAEEVGKRLIATPSWVVRKGDAREDFLEDHRRFLGDDNVKVRTVGGNKLDLYRLYVNVLRLGGLRRVVASRSFKHVAVALGLPKSCTSAAYILRTDYEKQLLAYEDLHVCGRKPANSSEQVQNGGSNVTGITRTPTGTKRRRPVYLKIDSNDVNKLHQPSTQVENASSAAAIRNGTAFSAYVPNGSSSRPGSSTQPTRPPVWGWLTKEAFLQYRLVSTENGRVMWPQFEVSAAGETCDGNLGWSDAPVDGGVNLDNHGQLVWGVFFVSPNGVTGVCGVYSTMSFARSHIDQLVSNTEKSRGGVLQVWPVFVASRSDNDPLPILGTPL